MMKKILYGLSVIIVLTLSGCGPKDEPQEKQDFYIQTRSLSWFTDQIVVQKSATMKSDQNIVMTAQANGRVGDILIKEWDTMKEGQIAIKLNDDVAQYGIALKRAKAAVSAAQLQYQNVKVWLEKNISDSQMNIQRNQTLLETAKNAGIQSIKNAEQQVNSADTRLEGMKSQFSAEKDKLENLFQTVLDFWDEVLWFSETNQYSTQDYHYLISAKDPNKKAQAKQQLSKLFATRDKVVQLQEQWLTNELLLNNLVIIQWSYTHISDFLIQMIEVINVSVDGDNLPQAKLDGFIATINAQKANTQQLLATFNAYKAQVEWILSDTTDLTKNTLKSSAQVGLASTKIQTKKNLKDAQLALKNANSTYTIALKSKNTQLSLLANAITQAQIAYENVAAQYAKLTVKSPIAWTIGQVMVDKGQEVGMWTPLFTISNETEQLVDIAVSANEHKYLTIDDIANITYEGEQYTGKVHAISSVASRNGLYTVSIAISSTIQLLGGVADIQIPVHVDGLWLPINMITIVGDNIGYIWSYDDAILQQHTVELGEIRGDNVQIINQLTGAILIISDISNFEPEKYQLVEKN